MYNSSTNNPGARGRLSGVLDFSSLLLAARGVSEAGEPVVSLRHVIDILNSVPYEKVRRNVCCLLWFCLFAFWEVIFQEKNKIRSKKSVHKNVKD